ncbi:hypothetical protein bmyco0002_37200 [Bacillus pseudomycoides]|uniref:HNH endonuclease n=1 Tax=Bacillus pseudomycoides TaxID=64104 RepID=UPI0001A161F2|nr:HNH endonuclease [Bacillus pseudomycoides]EEM03852.1 hypothetical protein bmyco0002_37200 [Bacillus pseudomycoides]PGC43495.1 HNH endonuclease [Bacillus pseudomycoides]
MTIEILTTEEILERLNVLPTKESPEREYWGKHPEHDIWLSNHSRVIREAITDKGAGNRRATFKLASPTQKEYKQIDLDGNKYLLSRLMLETFRSNPNSDNLEADHYDGNPANNHIGNLQWLTKKENVQKARLAKAKLNYEGFYTVIKLRELGLKHREIAEKFEAFGESIVTKGDIEQLFMRNSYKKYWEMYDNNISPF